MKKKILFFFIILSVIFVPYAMSNAVIKDIKGKVEIKLPGKSFTVAKKGVIIPDGTIISTGFRSAAVLDLGSSILNIKALTRMTLEELLEKEGNTTTRLNLRVGKVGVRVERRQGLTHDFKLRSPVSTAAVRGTSFDYDGFTLAVKEGVVSFFNKLNQKKSIFANESSSTTGYDSPQNGESGISSEYNISPDTSNNNSDMGGPVGKNSGFNSTGTIIVTVN